MSDLQVFAVLAVFVLGIGLFRVVTRRRLVEDYVARQGWRLTRIRYRLRLWNNLNEYFDIQVVEPSGRMLEGVAEVTGLIRSRVSIDWQGSGRGGI